MAVDLVYRFGAKAYGLNPRMAARQNLDQATADALKAKHVEMHAAKEAAKESAGSSREDGRETVAAVVERLEFEMQVLWGFSRDASMHSHWLTTPGCTCPKEPNSVLRGRPVRIVSRDCPLHDDGPRADGIAVVRDRTRQRQDVDALAVLEPPKGEA